MERMLEDGYLILVWCNVKYCNPTQQVEKADSIRGCDIHYKRGVKNRQPGYSGRDF
jgi:hypothetical protein